MANEEKPKTVIHLPKSAEGKKLRIRKCSPRECFRLMDVKDSDIDKMMSEFEIITKNGQKKISRLSDSALYQLAGNSIVVAAMEAHFEQLLCTDEVEREEYIEQLELF